MPRILTEAPPEFASDRVISPPLLALVEGERITTPASWEQKRAHIERDWRAYLGGPPFEDFATEVRTVREDDLGSCRALLLHLKTEPEYWEHCYLMIPKEAISGEQRKRPAVVVFYYDLDTPAGHYMGSRIWQAGNETRRFARHLVERGYVALVQRWFYEGYVKETPAGATLRQKYAEPVARQARVAPGWKGLGRVVWDASGCVDYLSSLDFVDPERIGCMGHSLGGKMALYAAAFDQRLRVAVSSEPGIGLAFSNWDDPWYLGPEVRHQAFGRDHHQLLALVAPRPFLLIAGESADGDKSWSYLNAAQDVYRLYGVPEHIGMFNHRSGHSPTLEACEAAYHWFDEHL